MSLGYNLHRVTTHKSCESLLLVLIRSLETSWLAVVNYTIYILTILSIRFCFYFNVFYHMFHATRIIFLVERSKLVLRKLYHQSRYFVEISQTIYLTFISSFLWLMKYSKDRIFHTLKTVYFEYFGFLNAGISKIGWWQTEYLENFFQIHFISSHSENKIFSEKKIQRIPWVMV